MPDLHTHLAHIVPQAITPVVTSDHSGAFTDAHLMDLWLRGKASAHTRRAYERDAQGFLAFIGLAGLDMRSATVSAMQDWIDSLDGKPSTRARKVAAVRSLLTFGQKTGYLTFNVGASVNAPKVPNELAQRILTAREMFQLMDAAKEGRERALITLLYASAIRVSEAAGLLWIHVRPTDRGAVLTIHGKGEKTRFVGIPQEAVRELEAIRTTAPSVFSTRSGRPMLPGHMRQVVTVVARRAGIDKPVSPHWFRHAHASHSLDRKCPVHVVQATLGHASLATTSRYVHVNPEDSSGHHLPL